MKRMTKLLVLLGVLCVLCAGAFAVGKLGENAAGDATETEALTLFSLEEGTLTSLSYTYLDNTLSFLYQDESWSYEEDPDFPLDGTILDQMLSAVDEIQATVTIESPEDLSQYGLEEPVYSVTLTAGETYTFCFGDGNTMGGSVYMSMGDGNVYLVDESIPSQFTYGLYDLVEKEAIPSMTELVGFTVESGDGTIKLCCLEDSGLAYSDSYVWFLEGEEGYTTLDTELVEDFTYHVTNMSWGECVEAGVSADDLGVYGLDDPQVTVTADYIKTVKQATNETDEDGNTVYETVETEETFVLEIGGEMDGNYYARIGGSDMVYLIDGSIPDAMRYTTVSELLPDEILLLEEEAILGVDVTMDGETYALTREIREVEAETEDSTEEPELVEEIYYLLDETEVAFQNILDQLLAMDSTGSLSGAVEPGVEEIAFTFHTTMEDYPEITLTFSRYNSSDCIVTLNGETRLLAARADVVNLAESFRGILLG